MFHITFSASSEGRDGKPCTIYSRTVDIDDRIRFLTTLTVLGDLMREGDAEIGGRWESTFWLIEEYRKLARRGEEKYLELCNDPQPPAPFKEQCTRAELIGYFSELVRRMALAKRDSKEYKDLYSKMFLEIRRPKPGSAHLQVV